MNLNTLLELDSCPHCRISNPTLSMVGSIIPTAANDGSPHNWGVYVCKKCGYLITARAKGGEKFVRNVYPSSETIDEAIPDRPKEYLNQALISIAAPSGCVMLCASSVDAMLKDKGFLKGKLYARINEAISQHLLTPEMGKWAHRIRLDANDERHADENATLPDVSDARNAIMFTKALAEYLYVLPAMVNQGISGVEGAD